MKRTHKKAQLFLAILISFCLPILSAYACSSNLAESDAFSSSLDLENPGDGTACPSAGYQKFFPVSLLKCPASIQEPPYSAVRLLILTGC